MAWQLQPPFTGTWVILSMQINDILSEHIDISINCPGNLLAPLPSLLYSLWRQEAKSRIDYLRDDHWENIFSHIKLLSYLQATECKWPLLPSFCMSKMLVFVSVVSAMVDTHRNRLARDTASCVWRSNSFRWPPVMVRLTHNYNFIIYDSVYHIMVASSLMGGGG